MGIGMTRIIFI